MHEISENSVLLVDDDPSIRGLLSMRLERAGFEVRQAEDGIDGLVKIGAELPKVIISDLEMPRMSGIEFITVVRRRFPAIPVIALSGSIPSEFPAGAKPNVWFEKGTLQVDSLLQAIHDLVRKTSGSGDFPQVVRPSVRLRTGVAADFILTCTDCLRTLRATSTPEDKSVDRTAICSYCEARVPYWIESTQPV